MMTISEHSLREQIRLASAALSHISKVGDHVVDANYARAGLSGAQLKALQRGLLEGAAKHLARAREAMLRTPDTTGLPGLPSALGEHDDSTLLEAQQALAAVWSSLAEFETLRGARGAAIAAYKSAVQLEPNDAAAHAQLADLFEKRHDLNGAKTHAERALEADPASVVAGLALARVMMRQQRFADAERAAFAAADAPRARADDRALAWALVGEARDRRDDAGAAFEAFAAANRLMRAFYSDARERSHPAHPANVRALTQFVEHMNAVAAPARFETPAPIFLMGFPRSGTTLIEQILASHSAVIGLGETDYLFEAISVVLQDGDVFDRVSAFTDDEIETVRAAYRRMVVADHPHADGRIIVDKHPLHIVLLPLINKVFPDAKIILSARDPRDIVLSCYQQCFGINVATAQFLGLEQASDYFDAVMSLMMACRRRLKLDVLEVEYGDVVADLDSEAQRLAAFMGVPFEEAMLRFHEHARTRAITSASARQVINPIYRRSVGRWRRYARQLAPVLPTLNKWARRLGYDE